MATMTITVQPVSSHYYLPKVCELQKLVESLCAILDKYKDWKDPLSRKLFAWGAEVISIDLQGEELSQESQMKASQLANDLATKILINPFDNSPLMKPVLDRGKWVWEQWMLNDYRNIAIQIQAPDQSPFDKKPFDITPHHFAWDVMEWANLGNSDIGDSEKAESKSDGKEISVKNDSPQAQMSRFQAYRLFALAFVLNQANEQIRKLSATIDEGAKTMEAFKEAQAKLCKLNVERAEASAKASEDRVNTTIAANEKANAATVSVLNNNLQQEQDVNKRLTKDVNAKTKQVESLQDRVAAQDQTIAHLSGQVNNLLNSDRGSSCIIC